MNLTEIRLIMEVKFDNNPGDVLYDELNIKWKCFNLGFVSNAMTFVTWYKC